MHTKKPIPEESIDRRPIIIATAIMSVFAILYVLFPTLLINVDDAASYVALAQGHIDKVAAPFSGRMLFALLARELGWLFGLDVAHGFGILSILSVFTFFYFVARILSDYTETRSLRSYILVSAIPFTWFTFGHAAMPEPIGFALTAAALRQFQRKRISIGCILIACAMATRETYILLMLVVCVWLIFRRDWWRLALSLVLGAAAWMLVQFFTKLGQPNVNNMKSASLYAGKNSRESGSRGLRHGDLDEWLHLVRHPYIYHGRADLPSKIFWENYEVWNMRGASFDPPREYLSYPSRICDPARYAMGRPTKPSF